MLEYTHYLSGVDNASIATLPPRTTSIRLTNISLNKAIMSLFLDTVFTHCTSTMCKDRI